jgi:hypothetical protein
MPKVDAMLVHGFILPVQILCFWTLSIILSLSKTLPVYFSKQRFGDWILSPSSGKTYSVGTNR